MDDTSDTNNTATRNTSNRSRCWSITVNNWTEEDLEAIEKEVHSLADYAYQTEEGKEGTPHIQAAFRYVNARTFASMKKSFPTWHIEPAKNWVKLKQYCKKSDSATGEIKEAKGAIVIQDPLKDAELYEWQQMVTDIVDQEPDHRTIHWFWEPTGNVGKTTLARHLVLTRPGVLYLTGKAADMKYGVASYVSPPGDKPGQEPKILILDFVRSVESFISYQGIEEIKNALFYNTKYESKMIIYNYCHVICFANFPPEVDRFSADRWDIIQIKK